MKFVDKVAVAAEQVQHHPDILIRYKKVTLTFATHDANGITQKDFDAATNADQIAAAVSPPRPKPVAKPARTGAGRSGQSLRRDEAPQGVGLPPSQNSAPAAQLYRIGGVLALARSPYAGRAACIRCRSLNACVVSRLCRTRRSSSHRRTHRLCGGEPARASAARGVAL